MKVGTNVTRSPRLLAYGVALLSVAVALGLALLLGVWIRPTPAALFFVAVMVSAWYGGLGPGLVTTILSTLAINYYFIPPYYSLKIAEPGSVIPLGVFVMAALLISGLNESRRLALRQEQRLRTASEAAQRDAQAAKERLETLLSSIKDGFYVLDCNWRYTYVNDRYCQIAGMQREEILGQNIWELFPDDVDTNFYVQLQRSLSEQKSVQFEYLYTTWNRWFEYRVYPTPNGLTVFIAEMTEHRQAELEIRKFVSLADNSTEFIGMCDMNFVPFYVNEAGRQLVGLDDARQYSETPVQEFFFPDDQDFIVNEFFPQVLREGRAEVEIRFRHFKTGEALWMIYNAFYIRGENDQPIGLATVSRDISDRKRAEKALQESEERFRLVTHAVNGLVFDWNLQTDETYRSEKLYDLVGVYPEDAPPSATWWRERIHPDDLVRLQPQAAELFASSDDRYEREYRIHHEDGRWVEVWERGCLIRDEQGQVIRVVGSTVDISERKQAQAALHRSEERFRVSQELSLDAFTILNTVRDETGVIVDFEWTYVNPKAAEILQHPADELVGQRLLAVLPGNQTNTELFERYVQVVETGEPHDIELSYNADGITGWFRNMAVKLDDGVAIFFSDITERKRAEAALRESERRFRRLVESNMFGVVFGDFTGSIHYANDYWLKMVGYTREEIEAGQVRWTDITPPEFLPLDEQAVAELGSSEVATPFEKEYIRKDGTRVPILIGSALLQEPYNQQQEIISFFLDLTERKQAEVERNQLLLQEQAAREAAESANRIKDEFLAVLSHELRSPLNPILGWSKLLRSRQLDEHRTEHALEIIERNAQMQAQLINDLLDVSRILRGKLSLNANSVDLVSTIQAAMETVRLAADAKSIQIHTRFEPEVGQVWGDSGRLQQVIWNLLSNAVKFTPQGGRVDIQLTRLNAHAQITISDTGKGIHPDFLPYVFDHFRQEDAATTRRFGGLGLGLAIVRYLVELHGGTVQVNSRGEGHGATFTIELPLMAHQLTTHLETKPSRQSLDLKGIQILVVDDDDSTREFLTFLLELHGANVIAMASADKAMTTLAQFKPDVLLSDIGMPDVDGYTLMRQVRALPPEQGGQIPAIALTAYAGEIDYQQAMAAGFQKHIPKPVEPDKLVEAIASLFGNRT